MRFKLLRKKDPELARAFDEHIREHTKRAAEAAKEKADSNKNKKE